MIKQQQKLLGYAYDLIAKRRYTVKQMLKKLDSYNQKAKEPLNEDQVAEVMASLIKSNFLNDKDYAYFFIEAQSRQKPAGKFKLKQQLKLKGLEESIVDQAIKNANLDEEDLAYQLACKKMRIGRGASGGGDYTEKMDTNTVNRLVRYLQTNGFALGTVFRVVKKINQGIESEAWFME